MPKKNIGIVGGMGPEATADLFLKIIKATPAKKDQDHIRVFIDNNTNIPDRTKAILGEGDSPLTAMKDTVSKLKQVGAEILVMPCNTAHYFYNDIATDKDLTFLHMMKETANYIKQQYPHARKIGILATSGTIQSQMYHKALKANDLIPLEPSENDQTKVMDAIYASWGIKAGNYTKSKQYLLEVAQQLIEQGAQVLILGCTEIPLVIKEEDLTLPIVDATQVLAEAAVKAAFN